MFSQCFKWAFVSAAAFAASVVLLPAAPSQAQQGPFLMTGRFETHNGFAKRRAIEGFALAVSMTGTSGMGAFPIPAGFFSETGNPAKGANAANIVCDPPPAPGALNCVLRVLDPVGFQPFPTFPLFAQIASTFTEVSTLMPRRTECSTMGRMASTPAACPCASGTPRARAQRRLPSMRMATCSGTRGDASPASETRPGSGGADGTAT